MSIRDIPPHCLDCPFISPYVEEIRNLETQQITPDIKERLVQEGLSAENIDLTDAYDRFYLEQTQRALSEAATRTLGCVGVRIVVLDRSAIPPSAGMEFICQSPHSYCEDDD